MTLGITVYSPEGKLWEGDAGSAQELRYPEDAPALSAGVRYSWTIESTDPFQIPPLRSQAAYFEPVGDEAQAALAEALTTIEELDISERAKGMLEASVLYEHGMLREAIERTESLVNAESADQEIRSILASLYIEAGRTEDALWELDRLLEPH